MSTEATPEAPYGYHADGVTPRRSNGGRPRGAKTGSKRTARKPAAKTAPAPPRKAAAAPSRKDVDYTEAFSEVAKSLGGLVMMGSPLDGAVLLSCADEIGEVGNELAQINDQVRALGDRFMKLGPWGRVSNLGAKILAQVAANHQWLPDSVTGLFGALPREQFAAQFAFRVHAAEQHAAAQAAAQAYAQQESAAPYPADSANDSVPFTRHEYAGATA